MESWTDFDLTLDADAVLRGQGADPLSPRTKRPGLVKAAGEALVLGLSKIKPVAILQQAQIKGQRHEFLLLENGQNLSGPLVARYLAGAQSIVAVICTIGPELEELASITMSETPLLGLALDGLGNAAVESIGQQVCSRIAGQAESTGLEVSVPLSPGDHEWPVEVGQPQLFSLLDANRAGVRLTTGGMMIPKKTISFVIGIGSQMEQADLCALCSMRERCHYRHT
jgi:hypothetical protein